MGETWDLPGRGAGVGVGVVLNASHVMVEPGEQQVISCCVTWVLQAATPGREHTWFWGVILGRGGSSRAEQETSDCAASLPWA